MKQNPQTTLNSKDFKIYSKQCHLRSCGGCISQPEGTQYSVLEGSRNTLGNGSSRVTTSFTFKLENLDSQFI